jgi:hypothetical protein
LSKGTQEKSWKKREKGKGIKQKKCKGNSLLKEMNGNNRNNENVKLDIWGIIF